METATAEILRMNTQAQENSRPQLTLRVFDAPDDDADDGHVTLSPHMSLCQFYEAYYKPAVMIPRDNAARTLREYAKSLDYWKDFTGDPPLSQINYVTCADFLSGLRKLPGNKVGTTLSNNTIRKHACAVQMILDMTGSPERKRRHAAGLLDRVPYVERPAEQETLKAEESFTLAEISAILSACGKARQRRGLVIPTPIFWRGLVTFAFNVGFRIETLMSIEWTMIEESWIRVPSSREVIKKGRGNVFYLNESTRAAIEPLKAFKQYSPRVFAWPNWSQQNQSNLQAHHHALQAAAGLAKERQFGFHGYRRAHAYYLESVNPNAAAMSLNHKDGGKTTRKHYLRKELLSDALDKMPQPAQRESSDAAQLMLF